MKLHHSQKKSESVASEALRRWTERQRELAIQDRLERVTDALERVIVALERRPRE